MTCIEEVRVLLGLVFTASDGYSTKVSCSSKKSEKWNESQPPIFTIRSQTATNGMAKIEKKLVDPAGYCGSVSVPLVQISSFLFCRPQNEFLVFYFSR